MSDETHVIECPMCGKPALECVHGGPIDWRKPISIPIRRTVRTFQWALYDSRTRSNYAVGDATEDVVRARVAANRQRYKNYQAALWHLKQVLIAEAKTLLK